MKKLLVPAVVALVLAGMSVAAVAAAGATHKYLTGCLSEATGVITQAAFGKSPLGEAWCAGLHGEPPREAGGTRIVPVTR